MYKKLHRVNTESENTKEEPTMIDEDVGPEGDMMPLFPPLLRGYNLSHKVWGKC